jgi:DNA-binding phage protein
VVGYVEEDIPIQAALSKVIRVYGLKEFATEINMPSSSLNHTLRPSANVTQKTLDCLLKPFGLRLNFSKL